MSPTPAPDARRRAMTLVEVLIAAGLLGIVLVAAYSALVLSIRYREKHDDQSTLLQQALVAVTQVQSSLEQGAADSLVYEPDGFAFTSAQGPDGHYEYAASGQLQWQKFVCFYFLTVDDKTTLYMKEQPLPPPLPTLAPTPPSVATMIADPTLQPRTIARDLYGYSLQADSAADVTLRLMSSSKAPNSLTIRFRTAFRQ